MVYHTLADIDFNLDEVSRVPLPHRVVLTSPEHFDVRYVINPHMKGHIGTVDQGKARRQWTALRTAYETLDIETDIVPGRKGLPDMVFCANQTLPYCRPDGTRGVVLSNMHTPERQPEVPYFADHFRQDGYTIDTLPDPSGTSFEGMGDAIWHHGRYLLWGGYGPRTHLAAYTYLSALLDVRLLALPLHDPGFYHLDTCFCILDTHTVLIYPEPFHPDSLALIRHFFDRVLKAPEEEARQHFACNAHCPNGKHVLIQRGCTYTIRLLLDAGYVPVELDTGEFLKAGGSVYCMKQMMW